MEVNVDISGPMQILEALASPAMKLALLTATGKAARRVEAGMKSELQKLVYDLPESPDYVRTNRLMNGAHAANPNTLHDDDDEVALDGDMAATSDTEIVLDLINMYMSEVGDWVSYAWAVHEGLGRGRRVPKPFSAQPHMDADAILLDEATQAVAVFMSAFVT